ncbi:MAG: DUF6443 domain-containing protein, partial [Bacteroidota bacterium]
MTTTTEGTTDMRPAYENKSLAGTVSPLLDNQTHDAQHKNLNFMSLFRYMSLLCGLLLLIGSSPALAQVTISGPATVAPGGTHTYTHNYTDLPLGFSWSVGNAGQANITGSNFNNATVNFTGTSGAVNVIFTYDEFTFSGPVTHTVTKTVAISSGPATPPTPQVSSNTCGDKTISYIGGPPLGEAWYWQTSATGTAQNPVNAASTYTMSSNGTIYLRGYKSGNWSSATSAAVTVNATPADPTLVNAATLCGAGNQSITVSIPGSPANTVARWFPGIADITPFCTGFNCNVSLTNGEQKTVYVSAYNTVTGCESARVAITASSNTMPPTPVVSSTVKPIIGDGTVTVNLQDQGYSYQWFDGLGNAVLFDPAQVNGSSYAFDLDGGQSAAYTVVQSDGSCASTTPLNVTVTAYQAPELVVSTVASARQITVNGSFDTYQWRQDGANISGATGASYNATTLGIYTVVLTKGGSDPYQPVAVVIDELLGTPDRAMNYVKENMPLVPVTTQQGVAGLAVDDMQQQVTYLDGLGRGVQTIATQASPGKKDIIQPMVYDGFGRQGTSYLPYTGGNDGRYKTNAINAQSQFYQNETAVAHSTHPYAESVFEASPLNRVLEQSAPGADWTIGSGHTIAQRQLVNTAAENIHHWRNYYDGSLPQSLGYYSNGELMVAQTKDEEGHLVREYTDKRGLMVLKRVQYDGTPANPQWADTYYLYDDLGNLRAVLPPEAVKEVGSPTFPYILTQGLLDRWAFLYEYDGRRRMVKKQVPGAKPVYMVYDKLDRLVMTQDGEQRQDNEWTFTKYDLLNRPILTGTYTLAGDQATVQQAVDNFYSGSNPVYEVSGASVHRYTNQSYPLVNKEEDYLTVTYYNDYSFLTTMGAHLDYATKTGFEANAFDRVTGQVTGTLTRQIDGKAWYTSVSYYDDRYRVVQIVTENQLGRTDRVFNRYDFTGRLLETITEHSTAYDVVWTDLVGVQVEGDKMTKVTGSAWTAGGASINTLPAGEDGWIEASAIELNRGRMIGLSANNPNAHFNTIDYALFFSAAAGVGVYENGTYEGLLESYEKGDRLRIERIGDKIHYKKNDLTFHTSTISSTGTLIADVSFSQNLATLNNIRTSFGGTGVSQDTTLVTRRAFDYDHGSRLLATHHQLDDGPEVILAENQYNELGELIEKNLHSEDAGTSYHQSVDYRYNIRGWLTSINNAAVDHDPLINNDLGQAKDLFGMQLHYNDSLVYLGNQKAHNGNISAIQWSAVVGLDNETARAYTYTYDALNRLKTAGYNTKVGANWTSSTAYTVSDLTYDLNGNIESLTRKGQGGSVMDSLAYDYTSSNQLNAVTDNGDDLQGFKDGNEGSNDYDYDDNGNMIEDKNKDITAIAYNYLNLPDTVTKGNGAYIRYLYDAAGIKLAQEVYDSLGALIKRTDYIGEFIYENDTLQLIQHEEGRVVIARRDDEAIPSPEYQYHLKDHLGNVRLTFTTKPDTITYLATMETENATEEEALFTGIDQTRVTFLGASQSPNEVVRLNANQPIGPAISLQVGAGDVVEIEAYAYFEGGSGYTNALNASALIDAIALAFGGSSGGTGEALNIFNNLNAALLAAPGAFGGTSDDNVPAAYLNYLLFDQDMNYVDAGFKPVSSAADFSQELLKFDPIEVKESGYIYIYVSNESNTLNYTYFDDLKVVHNASPVVQVDDYYPFGLTYNSYQRANNQQNRFLYNGKELQTDLDLGWYDYGARMYQADLGRWFNVDPLAEDYYSFSSYNYVANNPIKFIDPDGKQIRIGDNIYSYEENRDYSAIEDEFERDTYKSLDLLYSSGAMEITFGEGEEAITINILDVIINDTENEVSIVKIPKERIRRNRRGSSYTSPFKEINFDNEYGLGHYANVDENTNLDEGD